MKLDIATIKEISTGAVRVIEENGAFCFYRFTKEQEDLYERTKEEFYIQSFATAGVRLAFRTDSKTLSMRVKILRASERNYFSFDVFKDGELVGYLDNYENAKFEGDYTEVELPFGTFSKTFELGNGEKTVCVHFPYSVRPLIEEVLVDDDSFVEPVKAQNKMLAFGDSITQGYDALRPSNRYIARLANFLDADEINKGMGSDRFFPELAELKDDIEPDYIVVAHGTNDWRSNRTRELFQEKSKKFFYALKENYRNAKIIAISPIWRKDYSDSRPYGDFLTMEDDIREAVASLENVKVISGFDLVPHEETCYADLRLHPNDKGFDYYFNNLKMKLEIER